MRKCILYHFLILTLIPLNASTQNECFNDFKLQGETAMKADSFELAIRSFQSILQNCPINDAQKKMALRLLDSAYQTSTFKLKESIITAERNASEALIQSEQKQIAAAKARSNLYAYHSREETDPKSKLILAYQSRFLMDSISQMSLSSNNAFTSATRSYYAHVGASTEGFINDALILNDTILVKAIHDHIVIKYPDSTLRFKAHDDHILSLNHAVNGFISTSADGTAKLWDHQGNLTLLLPQHANHVNGAVILPNKSQSITYSKDGSAILFDLQNGNNKTMKGHSGNIYATLISSNGNLIITRGSDQNVCIWDDQGALVTKLEHEAHVFDMALHTEDNRLITCTGDGSFHIYNTQGDELKSIKVMDEALYEIIYSKDHKAFVTLGLDRVVRLWNQDGELIHEYSNRSSLPYIKFIDGGQKIAIVEDQSIVMYDFSGHELSRIDHPTSISSFNVSHNGDYVVIGGVDGKIKLWYETGSRILEILSSKGKIYQLNFSTSGNSFVGLNENGETIFNPIPDYIYQLLRSNPPILSKELKLKYELE